MGRPRKNDAGVREKSGISPVLEENPVIETPQLTPDSSPKGGAKKTTTTAKAGVTATADALERMEVDSTTSSTGGGGGGRKRGRKSKVEAEASVAAKRMKLEGRIGRGVGTVLTLGQGDTGQLGLGEDVMEKTRPGLVASVKDVVDVVAGGMHTAVVTKDGEVYTFGCNDEGALGREVEEEEECFTPGKVDISGRVVMLSAGDSHTAALTEEGKVFAWGTFRDSSGPIGLNMTGMHKTPIALLPDVPMKKIASGSDHLVMLSQTGDIFSLGNSEQGQLGRVPEMFAHRGGRRGLSILLIPDKIHLKTKSTVCADVWAGSWNTVALTNKGEVMVMGLNNYSQMGLDSALTYFMPTKSKSLSAKKWRSIAMGQHHTIGLDANGGVYAIGRSEYGRLGLGEEAGDSKVPTVVPALAGKECVEVACGTAVSYAITTTGEVYSWGMGTNGQLGTGEEDDLMEPTHMKGKQLENREGLAVSSGGQHTVILAKDRS